MPRKLRHTLAIPVRLDPACVVFACLFGTPAFAQQPFVVDDAEVTPRNVWQLEMNLEWDKLRLSARPNRSQTVFDAELGYGLAPRLEVSVDVPVISLSVETPDRPAGLNRVTGIGDVALAAKYRLTRNAEATHSFAASLAVELPTGSRARGLGSSLVDVGVTLGSQHRLAQALTLRVNGGIVAASNTQVGALGIRRRGTVLTAGTFPCGRDQPPRRAGRGGRWRLVAARHAQRVVCGVWCAIGARSDASPALALQVGCSIAIGP